MPFPRLFLVIAALCLVPLAGAWADSDPYTVANVHVDASAASSTEAQTIAINKGRQQAWVTLIHRLTPSQDWAKVPALDDVGIQRLIRTYDIANERRSTTRYVAEVTYVFNADAVRRFLRGANVAYTEAEARPILVIPMGQAYAPRSPWAAAWNDQRFATRCRAADLAVERCDGWRHAQCAPICHRHLERCGPDCRAHAGGRGGAGAGAARQRPHRREAAHSGRRSFASLPDVTVPVAPRTPSAKAFGDAADAAADAITNAWKSRSAVDFNSHAKLTANVKIASITDWGHVQQKLASVSTVLNVDVVAMNIGEAQIVITYAGSADQLHDFLSQGGLDLTNQGGTWWLAVAAAATQARPRNEGAAAPHSQSVDRAQAGGGAGLCGAADGGRRPRRTRHLRICRHSAMRRTDFLPSGLASPRALGAISIRRRTNC